MIKIISKLSQAGRITLVRSITFAVQVYWASTFLMPQNLTKMIRTSVMWFIWKGSTTCKFIASISFTILEKPLIKRELGIHNINVWNKGSQEKLLDPLLSSSDRIWVKWMSKHTIKGRNFWCLEASQRCSWSWRSLLKWREVFLLMIKFNLSRANKVLFWQDT